MFVLFMLVLWSSVYLYAQIKDRSLEIKSKKDAIARGADFYLDRRCIPVDVKTGVPYLVVHENGKMIPGVGYVRGDLVKVHAYTGKVIENLSQQKRDQLAAKRSIAKRDAVLSGEQYYVYEEPQGYPCRYYSDPARRLPAAPLMYGDVDTDERFFVYSLFFYRKGNPMYVNVLWSIDKQLLCRIIDIDQDTDSEIVEIQEEMDRLNRSGKNVLSDRKFREYLHCNRHDGRSA